MPLSDLPIDETLSLGVDVGIGSCGVALLRGDRIEALRVLCFPVPEDPKTKVLLNAKRRTQRLARRVIRRRRQRRNQVITLLAAALPLDRTDIIERRDSVDPWQARHLGLSEALSPLAFASAILHLSKRRGFRSNRKSEAGSNTAETGLVKQGIAAMQEKLEGRTVGSMLASDPAFAEKKRNRAGSYSHSIHRDDIAHELHALFKAQRRLGQPWATEALEEDIRDTLLFQRPLQNSEKLLGSCPFEPSEKRSSALAPGFERFRFLAKLNILTVQGPDTPPRRLTETERRAPQTLIGAKKTKNTYKDLRKAMGLPDGLDFTGVPRTKPSKGVLWEGVDIGSKKGSCAGTMALKSVLLPILGATRWTKWLAEPEALDRIAALVSFREEVRTSAHRPTDPLKPENATIEDGLRDKLLPEGTAALDLEHPVIDALLEATEQGAFKEFTGATSLSAKAARALCGPLAEGKIYSEACATVGYDHAKQAPLSLDSLKNPVVAKSIAQSWKLINAALRAAGYRPGRITIELARDVGKPVEVRNAIANHQKNREQVKDKASQDYQEMIGRLPTAEERLALELWREQDHRCPYSQRLISAADLDLSRQQVEIDHVLPRSRSQDNSYHNKVLCLTAMNRQKRNRTPFEWWTDVGLIDGHSWERFEAWIQGLKSMRGMKKRNLLMKTFADRQEHFVARNLNDTRYAARVLHALCRDLYDNEPMAAGTDTDTDTDTDTETAKTKRRIFTRPGALTAVVRRAWGVESLKKGPDGTRVDDDRHHAVDAACVAALGNQEALTQRLTKIYQYLEGRSIANKQMGPIAPPWPEFRSDLQTAVQTLFVARLEERKTSGAAHDATLRQRRTVPGKDGAPKAVLFERKEIGKVTRADLNGLSDDRHAALKQAVLGWMEADKKTRGSYPTMPRKDGQPGPEIRKLQLPTNNTAALKVQDGYAQNGDMARVDVFRTEDGFWLVPIYVHQINDRQRYPTPPMHACVVQKEEKYWEAMDPGNFLFSIHKNTYLILTKKNSKREEGYFRQMNRDKASIDISPHNTMAKTSLHEGRGVKTLASLEKYIIDILGTKHRVEREERQWPGADCI